MDKQAAKEDKIGISDRIVNFIQRNRKGLVIGGGVIAVGILLTVLIVTIMDYTRLKGIAEVDLLAQRYEDIREQENGDAPDDTALLELIEELSTFAQDHGAYTGARAYMLLGEVQANRKEWVEAENAWVAVAAKSTKSYMAPIALYNAASAAEERGDVSRAIELYSRSADEYAISFPLAARAYFAVGRLEEERNDTAAAIAAYRKIADKWPNDNWTKVAMSRIIALSVTKD